NVPGSAWVDGRALEQGEAFAVPEDAQHAVPLVSCGAGFGGTEIRIVDANQESPRLCDDGQIGEIWVSGPSVAQADSKNDEGTTRTFLAKWPRGKEDEGRFLRTGDLGFMRGGELFVTGRCKDLIIIRGRNLYPQVIESGLEASHPAIRPSG